MRQGDRCVSRFSPVANTCLVARRQRLDKQAGDLQRSGVSERADTSSSPYSPPSMYLPGVVIAGEARGGVERRARRGCGVALKDGGSGSGMPPGTRHLAGSDGGRAGGYCCCWSYEVSQLAAAENAGSARCAMFQLRPRPSLQPLPTRSPSARPVGTRRLLRLRGLLHLDLLQCAPGCKRLATPPYDSRCGRSLVRTWKGGNSCEILRDQRFLTFF